jgi:hypothetical protein
MAGGTINAAAGVGNGKGLSWNQMEMLALARAAPVVLQDATVGANQNASVLTRWLLVKFLRTKPVQVSQSVLRTTSPTATLGGSTEGAPQQRGSVGLKRLRSPASDCTQCIGVLTYQS